MSTIISLIGLNIYSYLNPTIYDEDFDLQYTLSDKKNDFYKERNNDISKEKYTYNNEIYINNIERYKIIVHSIDYTEKGEKILIITDKFDDNIRYVNLAYKNNNEMYTQNEIIKSKDSIFIYQLCDNQFSPRNLVFKGFRIKDR